VNNVAAALGACGTRWRRWQHREVLRTRPDHGVSSTLLELGLTRLQIMDRFLSVEKSLIHRRLQGAKFIEIPDLAKLPIGVRSVPSDCRRWSIRRAGPSCDVPQNYAACRTLGLAIAIYTFNQGTS